MHAFGSNVRFKFIIHPFVMPQLNLHRQGISLLLFRILENPKTNVLVTKCFALPYRFSKLVELGRIVVLTHQLSNPIDLFREQLVSFVIAISVPSLL